MYLRIRHPNCVSFYGVFYDQGSMYMVTEFMPNGALRDLLRTYAASSSPSLLSSSSSSSSHKPALSASITTANPSITVPEKVIEERDLPRRTLPLKMMLASPQGCYAYRAWGSCTATLPAGTSC